MKKLLEKNGIKVEGNKISKADLNKAMKILACNMPELMLEGKKIDEEFSKLFADESKKDITPSKLFNKETKACNMSDLLIEGKELETKKLDKLLVGGKKDKTMKGLTDTKEVLEDELSKIYDNNTKQKIEEKIEDLIVDNKSLKEKDFYKAKAAKAKPPFKIVNKNTIVINGKGMSKNAIADFARKELGLEGITEDKSGGKGDHGFFLGDSLMSYNIKSVDSNIWVCSTKELSPEQTRPIAKKFLVAKAELQLTREQISDLRKRIIGVNDEMNSIFWELEANKDGDSEILELVSKAGKDIDNIYRKFNADSKDINVVEAKVAKAAKNVSMPSAAVDKLEQNLLEEVEKVWSSCKDPVAKRNWAGYLDQLTAAFEYRKHITGVWAKVAKANQEAVGSPLEDALNDVRNAIYELAQIKYQANVKDFLNTPKGKEVDLLCKELLSIDNQLADML